MIEVMSLLAGVWPLVAAILAADAAPDPDLALARGWTWARVAPRPVEGAAMLRKGMVTVTSGAAMAGGDLLVGGVVQGPIRLGATSVKDHDTKVGFVARIDGRGKVRAVQLLDRREARVERAEEPAVTALVARGDGGFVASSRANPLFEMTAAGETRWSNAELPRAFSLALAENDDLLAAGCDRRSGRSTYPGVVVQDASTAGYAARLSPAGKLLWKVDLVVRADAQHPVTCGTSIAAAPGGDVIVGGTFEGELTVGGHVLRAEGWNGFVARLSAAGQVRWARVLDSSGTVQVAALTDGRVVVNGDVAGPDGSRRAGIAVLDAAGKLSWFLPAETTPQSTPRLPLDASLVLSGSSDVFWVGRFGESIRIADAQLSRQGADGGVFVAKVNGEGHFASLRNLPEPRDGSAARSGPRAWPAVMVGMGPWIWVAGELRGTSRGAFAHRLRR